MNPCSVGAGMGGKDLGGTAEKLGDTAEKLDGTPENLGDTALKLGTEAEVCDVRNTTGNLPWFHRWSSYTIYKLHFFGRNMRPIV